MDVPSFAFLAFAALVALVINVSSRPAWRRAVFLVANLAFLAGFSRDPAQLAPFAALLALGFASVKLLQRYKRKALFAVLLLAVLFVFCWLKRYTFIPAGLFLPYAYLAVGMSYVFFRIVHLVVDAYQDTLPDRVGLLSYVNYTLNFTSFVAGPIQLYPDYRRSESERPAALTEAQAGIALERIVLGFFKVTVVSPLLAFGHDRCVAALAGELASPERMLVAGAAFAMFPLYLYANFSGYTDVVIGVARFLRLELPENFDRPFAARGFIDFWGRWHMTLSNVLKTYVYSPLLLSLMRRYPARTVEPYLGVVAYFVTFFLVGVWHGRTSMFLMFGVLQGLGVSVNKLYQIALTRRLGRVRYRALSANPAYAAVSRGLTFTYFAFTLLWFWATWDQLGVFARQLGPLAAFGAAASVLIAASSLGVAIETARDAFSAIRAGGTPLGRSRPLRTVWCAALLVVIISVAVMLDASAPSIVYKAF